MAAVFWFGTARTQNLTVAWPRGYAYTYALDTRAEGIDTPGALFGASDAPAQHYKLEVNALLRATVLDSNDTGTTVALTFESPRVHFESPDLHAALDREALERDLTLTYAERTDPSGRVVAFVSDPRASNIGEGYVRALAGTLSLSKPTGARDFSRTWTAEEPVAEGVRSSTYEVNLWFDSPASVPTARFVRRATVASPRGDPHVVTPHVFAKSFDQGLLRADGVLSHLLATQSRGVRIGDRRIASSLSTVDATLIAIAPATASRDATRLSARLATAAGLYVAQSARALRERAYRDAARRTTFAALVRELPASSSAPRDTAARSAAFAAQFFVSDASAAAAEPLLMHAPSGSQAFEALKLGLQDAGTPAAQSVLARTMLARAHDPASDELAAALARVPQPDARSVSALEELAARNPARSEVVALSFGTAAASLESHDGPLANRIVSRLLENLAHARTATTRRVLVLALGNAGAPLAFPAIDGVSHDRDADLRAAAALALRAIPGAPADDALLRLLRDPSAIVRLDAATAFAGRDIDRNVAEGLAAALRNDANRDVRAAAIDDVATAYESFPNAAAILAQRAREDRDPNVRAKAMAAIRRIDAIRHAEAL